MSAKVAEGRFCVFLLVVAVTSAVGRTAGIAELRLKLLGSRFPSAVCLDGSSAGYYLRDNNASKWLLFFEGGAWCYDHGSCDGTVQGSTGGQTVTGSITSSSFH